MSVHDRKNLKSALESAILYLQKQGVEEARQDAWHFIFTVYKVGAVADPADMLQ